MTFFPVLIMKDKTIMAEPISTSAASGGAIFKLFGVPIVSAAAASALGFMVLWPKTPREAALRVLTTAVFSLVFGPVLVFMLHSQFPDLFASARQVATLAGMHHEVGLLAIAGPVMVVAGLPAWWILGAVVLWLERHKHRDIGELVDDVRQIARGDGDGGRP